MNLSHQEERKPSKYSQVLVATLRSNLSAGTIRIGNQKSLEQILSSPSPKRNKQPVSKDRKRQMHQLHLVIFGRPASNPPVVSEESILKPKHVLLLRLPQSLLNCNRRAKGVVFLTNSQQAHRAFSRRPQFRVLPWIS